MTNRFEGRVAAITGAGGGLGRAIAAKMAAEGAKLALFDMDPDRLADTAALCPGAIQVVGNSTSAADLARFAEETRAAFGPAEFLLPAAGIVGKAGAAIDGIQCARGRCVPTGKFVLNILWGYADPRARAHWAPRPA